MNARFGKWWQKVLVSIAIPAFIIWLLTSGQGIWADFLSVQPKLPCGILGETKISGPYRIAVGNIAIRRDVRSLSNTEEEEAKEINKQLFDQVSADFQDKQVKVGVGKPCDDELEPYSRDREKNLTETGKALDADLVVSVTLSPEPQRFAVEVELSIGNPARWNEAAELADYYVFKGGWVGTTLDVRTKADASVSEMLMPYLKLLRAMASYVNRHWQIAMEHLSTALTDPNTPDNLKTLAHVLKGNSQGRLGYLEEAEASYNAAIQINNSYVRAKLGLAEIDYQRGLALNQSCTGTSSPESMSYLDAAAAKYRSVLAAAMSSAIPDVDVRAKYGTGRIHTCKSLLGDPGEEALAIRDLQDVTRRFAMNPNKVWIKSVVAGAYGELGLIRCRQGRLDLSLENYKKAYEFAVDEKRAEPYAQALKGIESDPPICPR